VMRAVVMREAANQVVATQLAVLWVVAHRMLANQLFVNPVRSRT